jgi:hypothetical protein
MMGNSRLALLVLGGAGFRRLGLSSEATRVFFTEMSTLQEVGAAIAQLSEREQALLAAEFAANAPAPDPAELHAALQRGLDDVAAGRVRPIEDVPPLIGQWISKS